MARRKIAKTGIGPKCFFCGAPGPLTYEHVFPNWLKHLGFGGEGIREYSGSNGVPRFQTAGPFGKKIKIVCAPCNNVWMSGMEVAVKPLLLQMLNAQGQITLDSPDQEQLARWAFKTAAVLTQVDGPSPFPPAHRRELRQKNHPPRQSTIRIGTASVTNKPLGTQLGEFAFQPHKAHITIGDQRAAAIPAYFARFRLLNIVFEIFGYESANIELEVDLGEDLAKTLLPLWPAQHPKIWWPPTSLDPIGGVQGLVQVPIKGIPTFLPNNH